MVVVALAASCSGGADPDQANSFPPASRVEGDAYLRVDRDGNGRIGPAEVEPSYLVELPSGWVVEDPGEEEEMRLRRGSSVIIVQRLEPKGELNREFAHLVVEASREQGRDVEMVGEPRQRPVAGETALVFDELEREPAPAVLSRFALFDHDGVRLLASFSTIEPTLAPSVDVFEEVLGSWAWAM